MKQEQIIKKIFSRAEDPVKSVEDLGNLCPFLFATLESREAFNKALRAEGYEINEQYFEENDQIAMMAHPSCGTSNGGGYSGGHPACGSSNGWGGYGGGHPSCCSSATKPMQKLILPINREVGNQSGIRS